MKSKIQKNVLMLFRNFLKLGQTHLKEAEFTNYKKIVRQRFDENKKISRLKINFIEFKLREGKNLLNHLQETGLTNITSI